MTVSDLVATQGLTLSVVGDALRCRECGLEWDPAETTQWHAFLTEETPPQVVLYCKSCAAREFSLRRR